MPQSPSDPADTADTRREHAVITAFGLIPELKSGMIRETKPPLKGERFSRFIENQ